MRFFDRLRRRILRTHRYLIFKCACEGIASPLMEPEESVFVIDAENLGELDHIARAVEQSAADASDYFQDVRAGKIIAFVMLYRNEVVHTSYVFLRNKSTCILGLDKDTALIGNAFTVPSSRGKGCQSRSVALRAAIAQSRGFAFVAAETSPDNVASQRGLKNGGMDLVGHLDLVVILNCLVIRWRRPPGFALFGFCLRA